MTLKHLFLGFLLSLSFVAWSAWADDTAAAPSYPPNRIEASPRPTPKARIVAVPDSSDNPGSTSLGPNHNSQMGAGIQIPLGKPKKTLDQEKQDEEDSDE